MRSVDESGAEEGILPVSVRLLPPAGLAMTGSTWLGRWANLGGPGS